MPRVDIEANVNKRLVDGLAATLLDIDKSSIRRSAEAIILRIYEAEKVQRIIVLGAAGSNKSTLAHEISSLLGIPSFDVDEYIPEGSPTAPDYKKRLREGWYNLWPDVPSSGGWVIEHVEAGNMDLVNMFKPKFAILLNPGVDHLKLVASARAAVHGTDDSQRRHRAMETAIKSSVQFESLPGKVIKNGDGWTLKELFL